MATGMYIGVSDKARKVKNMYVGVGGKARKVVKGWIGDANGKARLFWSGGGEEMLLGIKLESGVYSLVQLNPDNMAEIKTVVSDYRASDGSSIMHAPEGLDGIIIGSGSNGVACSFNASTGARLVEKKSDDYSGFTAFAKVYATYFLSTASTVYLIGGPGTAAATINPETMAIIESTSYSSSQPLYSATTLTMCSVGDKLMRAEYDTFWYEDDDTDYNGFYWYVNDTLSGTSADLKTAAFSKKTHSFPDMWFSDADYRVYGIAGTEEDPCFGGLNNRLFLHSGYRSGYCEAYEINPDTLKFIKAYKTTLYNIQAIGGIKKSV